MAFLLERCLKMNNFQNRWRLNFLWMNIIFVFQWIDLEVVVLGNRDNLGLWGKVCLTGISLLISAYLNMSPCLIKRLHIDGVQSLRDCYVANIKDTKRNRFLDFFSAVKNQNLPNRLCCCCGHIPHFNFIAQENVQYRIRGNVQAIKSKYFLVPNTMHEWYHNFGLFSDAKVPYINTDF